MYMNLEEADPHLQEYLLQLIHLMSTHAKIAADSGKISVSDALSTLKRIRDYSNLI